MGYKSENAISTILGILAILIPTIIFFISSPEKITPTTVSIFIGVGIIVLIFSIYTYINSEWRKMRTNINKNKSEIKDIKKSLKYEKSYYDMEKRIGILEYFLKNRKAQIDPKILWWILIAVLLYLFLKSMNIIR